MMKRQSMVSIFPIYSLFDFFGLFLIFLQTASMFFSRLFLCLSLQCFFAFSVDCRKIKVVFSHASTLIKCDGCDAVLAVPRGGRCKLVQGKTWFSTITNISFIIFVILEY